MTNKEKKMTNKEILHQAFMDAYEASRIITELCGKVEDLFGEESPIFKNLDEASECLNLTSGIHYEIQGNFCGQEVTADDLFRWANSKS